MTDLTFPPKSVKFNINDGIVHKQDMSEGNIKTILLNDFIIDNHYNKEAFTLRGEWRYSQKTLNEIISNGYSVRKVEELVKALNNGKEEKKATHNNKLPETFGVLQSHLSSFFGTKVQLSCSAKGKGKISIPFNDEADLERIMEILDSLKRTE